METVKNVSSGAITTPAIADIRMVCVSSTAIKGSAIIQASGITKTSPMAKTDLILPF